jgi:hypothetical protein
MFMPQSDNPSSLSQRAGEDLSLIRTLMQRATTIVPMSGGALFCIGVLGVLSAGLCIRLSLDGIAWVALWCVTALIASVLALLTAAMQLRRQGHSILTGSHSRFWLSLLPGFAAALALTVVFIRAQDFATLPGLWLLLYGVSILAAGSQCIALISRMGMTFLVLGVVALFLPWPNLSMAAGFGLGHLAFGLLIARYNHE